MPRLLFVTLGSALPGAGSLLTVPRAGRPPHARDGPALIRSRPAYALFHGILTWTGWLQGICQGEEGVARKESGS